MTKIPEVPIASQYVSTPFSEGCAETNYVESKPYNPVNPDHYKVGGLEVIDILKKKLTPEEFRGFCKGVILQYILRSDYKNGIEDLKKTQWYLKELIKFEESHK